MVTSFVGPGDSTGSRRPRRRRRSRRALTSITVLVLGAGATVPALAADPSDRHRSEEGGAACEVHVLRTPRGAEDGTTMDIERVEGLGTVYYGSYVVTDDAGAEARRAAVWLGLDARPVPVGPRGALDDVAFELTPTGLVNGQSVVDDSGRERGWVQDLRTGRITWADGGPGPRDAAGIYFRRINRHGNAAGTLDRRNGTSQAVAWRRADRDPQVLPAGEVPVAEGWAVNDHRDVVGSYAVARDEETMFPQGVIWNRDGSRTRLAGLGFDSYPRLLTNDREAGGVVWYGSWEEGHGEAAFWPRPRRVDALGLLPGGGFSGVYGMSQAGWVVGVADVHDPDNPAADTESGSVDHSFLWTGEDDALRVLPSPFAVRNGVTDWRAWFGGAAHAAHTGLDQVGSAGHTGWRPDGTIRYRPTVWVAASRCGELVPTTHRGFWEEDPGSASRTGRDGSDRPRAYRGEALRERLGATVD